MNGLIGRKKESKELREYLKSGRAEFIGIYGRRRVGKTFLVNTLFKDEIIFYVSGLLYGKKSEQVSAFQIALRNYGYEKPLNDNWLELFNALQTLLSEKMRGNNSPCVVFIDELPCFDRKGGTFVRALGQFWNTWATWQANLKLIVCGSATSWMVRNIINNRGGLYNRLTHTMHLSSFSLCETAEYLSSNGFRWTRQMIAQAYMVFGGVPYYLSKLKNTESLAQNIDRLCFSPDGELKSEYNQLYRSLFDNTAPYLKIIQALAANKSGLTRLETAEKTGMKDNGHLSDFLRELVDCDVLRYTNIRQKKVNATGGIYQLCDFFTLFWLSFESRHGNDPQYWQHHLATPTLNTWYGFAFERLCMAHVAQIRKALKIDGIATMSYSWRGEVSGKKTQIDLIIERADSMINVCEIKYSDGLFCLKKNEAEKIRLRCDSFAQQTNTRCGILPVLITTNGSTSNSYDAEISAHIVLNDLFAE